MGKCYIKPYCAYLCQKSPEMAGLFDGTFFIALCCRLRRRRVRHIFIHFLCILCVGWSVQKCVARSSVLKSNPMNIIIKLRRFIPLGCTNPQNLQIDHKILKDEKFFRWYYNWLDSAPFTILLLFFLFCKNSLLLLIGTTELWYWSLSIEMFEWKKLKGGKPNRIYAVLHLHTVMAKH